MPKVQTGPHELTAVVGEWVALWARARGVAATPVGPAAFRVPIDAPTRREEVVLVAPSEAELVAVVAEHAGDDGVWVTVVPPPDERPPGTVVVEHAEALMATVLPDVPRPDRPGLRREVLHGDDAVIHLAYDVDGEEAARGVATTVGDVVVFDRILTGDAFRRQGFGRDVMAALTAEARERGATRGLLVASRDGQALYASLGWETVARVTTYTAT